MKKILSHNETLRSELETFIKTKKITTDPAIPWKVDFLNRLLPFATTGKLLRGSLVCFSYEAFSGQAADESVMKAAMALELAHSALLIHDDIMDGDAMRRGQPSMHQQYQTLAGEKNLAHASHFGTSMAMCGGDAALFLAFELLGSIEAKPEARAAAMELFSSQLVTTCAGQMQDLYFESGSAMPAKGAIYDLMETKTASYTLSLPLAMGAALAGEPPTTLTRLQAIGISAGVIFQIRDDELGVMGDARETGKPVGADITEGKKTLLCYYLLEQCDDQERKKLRAIFGDPDAAPEDITYVQQLVQEYDITQLLNNEIGHLERQALRDIEGLALPGKAKKELVELVRFCGERRS